MFSKQKAVRQWEIILGMILGWLYRELNTYLKTHPNKYSIVLVISVVNDRDVLVKSLE